MVRVHALVLVVAGGVCGREPMTPQPSLADRALAAEAVKLNADGVQLYQRGRTADAIAKVGEALEIRRKLYPPARYPSGHSEIAESLSNVGFLLNASGSSDEALPYFEQALAMRRRLGSSSNDPAASAALAASLNNLGTLLLNLGAYQKALPILEEALTLSRKLFPVAEHPNGHPAIAHSLNSLGGLLEKMGQYERALPHFEQALAMHLQLFPASRYPDGHPHVAFCLNNLGNILSLMGMHDRAQAYFEQALAMRQQLYPSATNPAGHPELVQSLINLGAHLRNRRDYARGIGYIERSLAMNRALYPPEKFPDGHPELCLGLINLGFFHYALGSPEQAIAHYEQAVAMARKLYPASRYPDGHDLLATALSNLAFVMRARGEYTQALPHCVEAMAMSRRLGRRVLATASEAEALAFAAVRPRNCDRFLTLTALLPDTAAVAYDSVWFSKAAITRVLEQRHAAARIGNTDQAGKLDELRTARRRIDRLLQDRRLTNAERDRRLATATDERDALERALAAAAPILRQSAELDALGPDSLAALLPTHAVVIDFVRYDRFDQDRSRPGLAGESETPVYAAFVLAHGSKVRRIELGKAAPIDQAVARWRAAIEGRTREPAADQLRDLVWAKLAPHLPAGTTTVYLAPDGDLARIPWAALPTSSGRVLLDEHAIATIPHAPFLLQSLKYPRSAPGAGTSLLLGGIDHKSQVWPNLPGASAEVQAIAQLANGPTVAVSGAEASVKRLAELLPRARWVHFATHGYFDSEGLDAERQRSRRELAARSFGDDSRHQAGKHPLAFTGLVLSGGEILSGLALVDLPLENVNLVTLSACETGLGELTGGEGVQGLQRAFHLAGCPNVIASLWKVNDAATAALMAKFYHELWVNKKPPIEALREAQLTIYRHPELIPELAGERGVPKLKEAVAARAGEPSRVSGRILTPTKLWAAFVLSGVGR